MNYTAVLAMLLGRFHFELAPEVPFSPVIVSPRPLHQAACMMLSYSGDHVHTQTWPLASQKSRAEVQMGGAEGVLNAEHMAMTLQPGGGLLMRVTRRELMTT